jgi:hypothetical protein
VPFLVRGSSTSRAPLHAGARTPVAAPLAGERPAALPAVLRSDGPSGHPLAFGRRCRRLPCSGMFLPGARRASPVPALPFAACCRHYPAGTGRGYQPAFFRARCCLRHSSSGSASGSYSYRGLHDVRCLRPTASLPGLSAGFVRRYRAVLSPFQRVSSASRLPGRYRVEIFTRWVAPPFFWSRR